MAQYEAIEILLKEHRLIEQMMGSLETLLFQVAAHKTTPTREIVGRYATFIRDFADSFHHAKEEDRLFEAMVENGFPKEMGPIAIMLQEHEIGRSHVGALLELAQGEGDLTPDDLSVMSRNARGYIDLLREHIMKEDNILYPMAEQGLSPEIMAQLLSSFQDFEENEMGGGMYDRFAAEADALKTLYPPDPARMAAASSAMSGMGCMSGGCHHE